MNVSFCIIDRNRKMETKVLNNRDVQILRRNCSSSGVQVSEMSERERKLLKTELKHLRQTIVESLAINSLEEIIPTLRLVAYYKCDPSYKYPSFDFVPMLYNCYVVSYIIYFLSYRI